jgi:hypothetical protein
MIAHAICFGVFASVLVLIYGLAIRPMKRRIVELEEARTTIPTGRDTIPSPSERSQAWTFRIECKIGRGV